MLQRTTIGTLQRNKVAVGDYLIQLRPKPGTDAIHNLRGALKVLLRRYDLRAITIEEINSFNAST